MKLDSKTIAAIAALVAALAGGVEMRVQVGLLSAKVDRIEAEQRSLREDLRRVTVASYGE